MLNVLWFTNVFLPEAAERLKLPSFHKAGWLESYLEALRGTAEVSLTIVTRSDVVNQTTEAIVDGVQHILLPCAAGDLAAPPTNTAISEYCELIQRISPSLIHYHGSEFHYGLLSANKFIDVPAVLSIQGIVSECEKAYYGGLTFRELLKAHTLKEIYHRGGIWGQRQNFKRRAIVERNILQGMNHVIGRTLWDRAHVREINPAATYHHCDELLRPPFYSVRRDPEQIKRFSIFTSTASYPLKGFHLLLKAVSLLKNEFPEISVRIADVQNIQPRATSGYYRFLFRMIHELDLNNHIEWHGSQNAAGMAAILSTSHVFVVPSLTENISNALAEAMLVGVPSIATYTGGMTTTLNDRETGLCFPIGDYTMLAENIRLLFTDDMLAHQLAVQAQEVARKRHDHAKVVENLVEIYRSVIDGKTTSCTTKNT